MQDHYTTHGAFSWNELMTTDPEAAQKFYGEVFGWGMQEYPMGDFNYTVVKIGEEAVGGISPMPPESAGTPPNWGTYITVDNVDVTVEKVTALNGKVLSPPTDIPDVGRYALLQDPQGATLHAIEYKS